MDDQGLSLLVRPLSLALCKVALRLFGVVAHQRRNGDEAAIWPDSSVRSQTSPGRRRRRGTPSLGAVADGLLVGVRPSMLDRQRSFEGIVSPDGSRGPGPG